MWAASGADERRRATRESIKRLPMRGNSLNGMHSTGSFVLRSSNFSSINDALRRHWRALSIKTPVALATLHLVNPVIRPPWGVFVPRAISIKRAARGRREIGPLLHRWMRYSSYRTKLEDA